MSWERSAAGTLARVVLQTTDTILPIGGVSAGNSSTTALGGNPLAGHRIWDDSACFLRVDNVLTGTWAVEVQGTIAGMSALPLARFAGITLAKVSGHAFAGTSSMAFGTSCLTLINSNGQPSMLSPTSVLFDNTAAGGMTASVIAVAKTNRGSLPKGTLNRSRVQEGVVFSIPVIAPGAYLLATAGVTTGITQTTVVTLSNTTPAGTTCFGVLNGLNQVQVWDSQMYWLVTTGCSGLWNVMVQGLIPGSATHFVTIAGVSNIGAGTTALGVTRIALTTFGGGAKIRPTRVVFEEVTAGVSLNISGTMLYAAKTTRGQRHMR